MPRDASIGFVGDFPRRRGCDYCASWYDGAFDPRDRRYESQRRYFDAIASTPGLQLRLGHLREVRPRWQYALRKALESCGVDEAEFGKHFSM